MARHDQLVKILGLLGSAHDGEVVAAAQRAMAYLAQHKLRWADIVGGGAPERRTVERRLLALRDQARLAPGLFDKEEVAELRTLVREHTLESSPEPAFLRRLEWLEAIVEHAAERSQG